MQSNNIEDILEPIRLTPNVTKLIKNKPAPAHIPHLPLTLTDSPRQRLLKLTKIQLKNPTIIIIIKPIPSMESKLETHN